MLSLFKACAHISYHSTGDGTLGEYVIQNVVGVYLGQRHTYKDIVGVAKWLRESGWDYEACEVTKKQLARHSGVRLP